MAKITELRISYSKQYNSALLDKIFVCDVSLPVFPAFIEFNPVSDSVSLSVWMMLVWSEMKINNRLPRSTNDPSSKIQ